MEITCEGGVRSDTPQVGQARPGRLGQQRAELVRSTLSSFGSGNDQCLLYSAIGSPDEDREHNGNQ